MSHNETSWVKGQGCFSYFIVVIYCLIDAVCNALMCTVEQNKINEHQGFVNHNDSLNECSHSYTTKYEVHDYPTYINVRNNKYHLINTAIVNKQNCQLQLSAHNNSKLKLYTCLMIRI